MSQRLTSYHRVLVCLLGPLALFGSGCETTHEEKWAGITRVSLGVMTLLKAFGALKAPVQRFLQDGEVAPFFVDAPGFPEINGLFG